MLPKIDWSNQNQLEEIITNTKNKISSKMTRNFDEVWNEIKIEIDKRVDEIKQEEKSGSTIPQITMKDILDNRISDQQIKDFKKKGAMVIRNVIPQEKIVEWYEEFKKYLVDNNYENQEIDPNLDTYFSNLKNKKPQIFNIFWSKCQINIRQHTNLAYAKQFLNQFWISKKNNTQFFNPNEETIYADRIRVRNVGDNTLGLSPHIDGGSVERWLDDANLKIYKDIYLGNWNSYCPFNGEYRNEVENIPSPAVCQAFRTYQAWVALTPQGPNDGTLQLVPMLKESTAYFLLRPFCSDVPTNVLCGAEPRKAQSINREWHNYLLQGLVSIPKMNPGDTVWWHSDLIHAVEDEHQGNIESSVTYIGSAPRCKRNEKFLELQKPAFLKGLSSPDFAAENREVAYVGRATLDDLTPLGRKQMGF